jgi:hypothetical protein
MNNVVSDPNTMVLPLHFWYNRDTSVCMPPHICLRYMGHLSDIQPNVYSISYLDKATNTMITKTFKTSKNLYKYMVQVI